MKKIFSACLFGSFALIASATHNMAGHISYAHLTGLTYEITIETFTDVSTPATRCSLVVYTGDGDSSIAPRVNGPVSPECTPNGDGVVLLNFDGTSVRYSVYKCTHTYAGSGSYLIRMTDPNMAGNILNISNSVNTALTLEARLVISPLIGGYNNSAVLSNYVDVDSAAVYQSHTYNSEATDPDGDSLAFTFIVPIGTSGYVNPPASLGFWINNFMGEVAWDSPTALGAYVYAIRIDEYRLYNNQYYFVGYTTREVFTFVATTVSTHDMDPMEMGLSIFPNPSQGTVNIRLDQGKDLSGIWIELMDAMGKRSKLPFTSNGSTLVINSKGLSAGLYLIRLMDGDRFIGSAKCEIIE